MDKKILDIYKLLQEIAWCFGSHGVNGECCGDLTLTEFIALRKVLENTGLSVQDIGNSINFTKSGATRIIDRLVRKGYVTRGRSPLNYRVCCITATEKGTEVVKYTMEKYSTYLEMILGDLDTTMIDNIKEALAVLVESVHKHELV